MMQPQLAMKKARRNVIIGLIAATLAVNSLILLSPDAESKSYFGNLLTPIVAAVATGLAIIVVYRQRDHGIFGRSYAGLAVALVFYLIAEILWAYYSIGLGLEDPFPSLADAFWLAGYVPFGYALFSLSGLYSKQSSSSKKALIVMGVAVAAFSSYYVVQLMSVSDLTSYDDGVALAISIAYPILDGVVLIPALLAVMTSGRGYLTSVPWIFVSWIFTAIADSIFGFAAATSATSDITGSALFYNAAYLSMAAGLFWHNRYMIFSGKHEVKHAPVS